MNRRTFIKLAAAVPIALQQNAALSVPHEPQFELANKLIKVPDISLSDVSGCQNRRCRGKCSVVCAATSLRRWEHLVTHRIDPVVFVRRNGGPMRLLWLQYSRSKPTINAERSPYAHQNFGRHMTHFSTWPSRDVWILGKRHILPLAIARRYRTSHLAMLELDDGWLFTFVPRGFA